MNLNIITPADAMRATAAVKADTAPLEEIANESIETDSPSKAPQVTADDLYGRLLKFIPAPLIGIYLLAANAVIAASGDGATKEWMLGAVLVFFLVGSVIFYRRRGVQRVSQIILVAVCFLVYAAGSPGFFTYVSWWQPLYNTLALIAVGAILAIWNPKELSSSDDKQPATMK